MSRQQPGGDRGQYLSFVKTVTPTARRQKQLIRWVNISQVRLSNRVAYQLKMNIKD